MPRQALPTDERRVNVVPISMTNAQYERLLYAQGASGGKPLASILYAELVEATQNFRSFPVTQISIDDPRGDDEDE